MRRALCFLFLIPGAALGQASKEQPVGLVLRSDGASLLRAGTEMALTARTGDILFSGDSLRAATGSVSFLFCPEKSQYTLPAGGQVIMDAKAVQVRAGQLGDKTAAPFCVLPQLERNVSASALHIGGSATRAMKAIEAPTGSYEQRVAALPAERRTALAGEVADADKALAANADNIPARLARAQVLEKYGLAADAAAEYTQVRKQAPDAAWVQTRLFTLDESAAQAEGGGGGGEPSAPGKTYALLVGISSFKSPDIRPLSFAHEDAALMNQYLRSDRGGKLTDAEITVLTNKNATTAAIRNAFQTLLKAQVSKNDTVILLLAMHGTVVETKGKRGAYIVTYDSDPQDLEATALPMGDVQKLIQEDLTKAGRVIAYVDVCRSGTIGTIPKNAKMNSVVERLAESNGTLFLFTASRSNEFSFEGSQYGGGHGAFSFFLLEALNGAGDLNSDGKVVINELIEYTQLKVAEATQDRQHPREGGNYDGTVGLADSKLPGITMKKFVPIAGGADRGTSVQESRSIERTPLPALGPRRTSTIREAVDFEEALDAGRLLPDNQRSAFTALRQYQRQVKPPEYIAQANRLKTALEDRGQEVILKYLQGDQVPQTKSDFAAGAAYFGSSRVLTPESVYLESRETFCLGRLRLFDKDYAAAEQLLERAVRLDPEGAYSYNALGIAALEQANFDKAARAFREAVKRAPYWAYPMHNLALAYTQMGNYAEAVRTYQEAMKLAPNYSYLPYNLGLVSQRLNRRGEAEAAYKKALELAPNDPMPLNALGYLAAASGKRADAERYYKEALAKDPNMLVARHNLAVLLSERKDRVDEAIGLWKENLVKDANHLPSRLSLARVLAEQGKVTDAIAEYDKIVKEKPEYAAARVALGTSQAKAGQRDAALGNLREAVKIQPGNLDAWDQIGDLEKAAGRQTEAKAAYEKAVELAQDGSTKKRIRKKM
jgi:tetratricopeptide (TPR) repeat protein